MALILFLYASIVLGLLAAELTEHRRAQFILKPLAVGGFLLLAVISGALDDTYGRFIFLGLMACAIGDVLLLTRTSQKLFIGGIAAFAIGHIAYLSAFVWMQSGSVGYGRFALKVLVAIASVGFFIWIRRHLPRDMQTPVALYSLIIMMMVIGALGLPQMPPLYLAIIGAVMFAVSDIFVAKDRFVSQNPKNALGITPLYFGGQALIILSTQQGF